MTAQPNPEQPTFPEQMVKSRVAGDIPAAALPWLHETDQEARISISEAEFPDGTIYIASAIPKKLAGLSEEVRKKDAHTSPDGRYSRLDEFYLQAARLEANGQAVMSDRVHLVKGRSEDFADVTVKSFGESPKPNTRRMYYVQTRLSAFRGANEHDLRGFKPKAGADEIDYDKQLIIRLGYADKQNQLEFLHALTGKSRQRLKKEGAGSV